LARVVLLGIDGCPVRHISADVTPHLWDLRKRGGLTLDGVSPLPATTYPCFGTLLTGCLPAHHAVRTTASRPGAVPGWAGQTRVAAPTLFDLCRAAGLRTAAVQGDHLLLSVLRAAEATDTWPPLGHAPSDVPRDAHGYVTNEAVRPHLLAAAADASLDLLFGQINEGDTLGHDLGPDDSATRASYAQADRIVGEVLDVIGSSWERTLVIVVSDHGMEARTDRPPIDLLAAPRVSTVASDVIGDGGAALVRLRDGFQPNDAGGVLADVPGVGGWSVSDAGTLIAEAEPGWIFTAPRLPARGYHGGPATAHTFAAVTGGHPAVATIARVLAERSLHLADWAPTIARLLGLELPGADGRSLLAG
jgi:arylsulfatase A-like enzyme